jgi:hypothetical protein
VQGGNKLIAIAGRFSVWRPMLKRDRVNPAARGRGLCKGGNKLIAIAGRFRRGDRC